MKNNKNTTPVFPKPGSIVLLKVLAIVALLLSFVFIRSLSTQGQLFALGITGPIILLIGTVYLVKGRVNLHPAYLAVIGLVLLMVLASFFTLF